VNQEKPLLNKIRQTLNVVTDISKNIKQVSSQIVLIVIPEVLVCLIRRIPRHKEARRFRWGIVDLYVASWATDFVYGVAGAFGAAISFVLKFSPARLQHPGTVRQLESCASMFLISGFRIFMAGSRRLCCDDLLASTTGCSKPVES
jgi:hypothetical protein